MKEYIDKRMDELWDKLPNADSDPNTWTQEEWLALGAYKELERLEREMEHF